jgi:hypothetical protein
VDERAVRGQELRAMVREGIEVLTAWSGDDDTGFAFERLERLVAERGTETEGVEHALLVMFHTAGMLLTEASLRGNVSSIQVLQDMAARLTRKDLAEGTA